MTKKELYAVYADLCCDIGKSPISFKHFLTLSIARKRAASEEDFIRFVAAYGVMAGKKLIEAVEG